jgi:hypothetical protein
MMTTTTPTIFRATPGRSRGMSGGFLALEMTIGLVLLLGIAAVLAVVTSKHTAATRRLEDSRAAVRLAEEAMTALQLGEELPEPAKPDDEITVAVEPLPDASAVAGTAWARVRTTVRGRSAELVGLVAVEQRR